MTDINYMNDLKVEVQVPTSGLQNLIKNPSGEQGAWGWVTPVANTTMQKVTIFSDGPALQFATSVAQALRFESEFLPMTASWYAVAQLRIRAISTSHGLTFRYDWYNSSKVFISSSTATAQTTGTGVKYATALQAPANTAYAKLVVNLYGNAGSTPISSAFVQFDNAMVARSSTSTGFGSTRENLFPDPGVVNVSTDYWEPVPGFLNVDITRATSPVFNGTTSLRLSTTNPSGGLVYAQSKVDMPVTAGQHYTASTHIRSASGSRNWKIGIRWRVDGTWGATYNAGGAFGNSSTAWTRMSTTLLAPAGADMAKVVVYADGSLPVNEYHYFDGFMLEKTNVLGNYFDGATAASGGVTYTWSGTPNASKSLATTASSSFAYNPPFAWLPITGSVTSLNIDREAMNLGTCSVVIKNESLDPAGTNKTLTPGKQVRVQARDGAVWKNIYYGKINNAVVDYEKKKVGGSLVEGTISITAVDGMSDLVNQGESRSVATIAELPYLLEGKGVPWNCNGVTSHINTATIPVTNDNASIADQIVLTRDSARGLAWIDKDGVLQVQSNPTSPTAEWVITDYIDDGTTNYMPNGNFEAAGVGPWNDYAGATAVRSTSAAKNGTNGLRLTRISSSGFGMDTWPVFTVPHEGLYQLTYWVRSSVAGAIVTAYGNGLVDGFYETVLPTANTWYQIAEMVEIYDKDDAYVSIGVAGASFGTFPTGGTVDFDDFTFTAVPTNANYSDIDTEWNTDKVMNQVELKHLTVSGDGNSEEVPAGTYENTTSVTTYGPKKATFTLVGTGIDFTTYASNILSANATPKVKANSLRIPIKDTSNMTFATGIDLCDYVYVHFGDKVSDTYRVATIGHSVDAGGWFIDITFDTVTSNPAPQYTPAPPVSEGVGTPAMRCTAPTAQAVNSGAWTQASQWLYDYSHPDIVFSTPGNFAVQKAGIYDIGFTAMFRNEVGSAGVRAVQIRRNGAEMAGYYAPPLQNQGDYASAAVRTKYKLNAGDVITFWVLQNSGGVVTVHNGPWTTCDITKVVGT